VGFIICSAPSFVAGVIFFRKPIEAPWTRSILQGLAWCLRLDRLACGATIAIVGVFVGVFAVYIRMV
jgi:hypothetical protein